MFLVDTVLSIFNTVAGGVTDHLEGKRQIKQAKMQVELAILEKRATADIDWDTQAQINAQTSWKDEWFVILLSVPAIMAFIPGLAQYVGLGFDELGKAPDWYLGAFGIAVAASFGFRKFADRMVKK
jgi:hypothetical protein